MNEELQVFISDWDGTLFNSRQLAYGLVKVIFEEYGIKEVPTIEVYLRDVSSNYMESFWWKHGVPRETTADDLNKIRKRYFDEHWNKAKLYLGARELLDYLKQHSIRAAIVSAEVHEILEKRLSDFGLNPFFDYVRGDANNRKETVIAALDYFGVRAEHAIYLDDMFEPLNSVKDTGIIRMAITHGNHPKERLLEAKPDFVVGSLYEVIATLQKESWLR